MWAEHYYEEKDKHLFESMIVVSEGGDIDDYKNAPKELRNSCDKAGGNGRLTKVRIAKKDNK